VSHITPEPVREYLAALRTIPHPHLLALGDQGRAEGLPLVHPETGALLHTLVRAVAATRVLEIGTAIGYSALWMASAMPRGSVLISLEKDADRAARARAHLDRAGVADRVNVVVGDASRFLHKVAGPFDLVFQDGDKVQYEPMLPRLHALLRGGGALVTDNILWNGEVVPGYVSQRKYGDADTAAIVHYSRALAADARFSSTFLPVGDGVSISIKVE
jgi:predicted O-methyltransferase YrrM